MPNKTGQPAAQHFGIGWYDIRSFHEHHSDIVACSLSKAKPNVQLHLLSSCTVNFQISNLSVWFVYPDLNPVPKKTQRALFLRICSAQCFIGLVPSAALERQYRRPGGPTHFKCTTENYKKMQREGIKQKSKKCNCKECTAAKRANMIHHDTVNCSCVPFFSFTFCCCVRQWGLPLYVFRIWSLPYSIAAALVPPVRFEMASGGRHRCV